MATIAALTPIGSISGSEEFVINAATLDRKCTATQITATVAAGLAAEIVTRTAEVATLTTGKLNLSGGTMTGALVLNGAPIANLHAATKLYVDGLIAGLATLASPTLTGSPVAPTAAASATSGATQVATTQYSKDDIYAKTNLKKTVLNAATLTLTTAHRGTIAVDYSDTGTTNITLPVISALTIPLGYEYYIVDTGGGAGTRTITITAGAGNTVDGSATTTITTNGESMLLANDGGTVWYIKDKDSVASATVQGKVELATTGEAAALTDSARAVTAAGIGAAFDAFPYNITELGSPSHVLTESQTGTLYITRTFTGTCAITLPNPATLTSPARTQYAIYDAKTAGINNATITTAGGTIDGGTSFVINETKMGATFITDGTNWISIANTNGAFSGTASTPWQYNGADIYFGQEVVIGDTTATNSLFNLDKSTGDVGITFSQNASAKFILGIDDTDDDLKLSVGGALGTDNVLIVDNTNKHMALGPVGVSATVGYNIQNTADTPATVLAFRNSAGVLVSSILENGGIYSSQQVSVGTTSPTPNNYGFLVSGTYLTGGLNIDTDTSGSNLIGTRICLATVNAGFTHTGITIDCQNATNNYALIVEPGGGNVGFGTLTPNTSAILELDSTTGALLLPRMTTAQEGALTAANGMIIYNTSTNKVRVYEGGAWANVI